MRKLIFMLAIGASVWSANAQKTEKVEKVRQAAQTVLSEEVQDKGEDVRKSPSTGELYGGLTRAVTFDRMIPPYGLEVTFNKTVHLIFPSAIRYVDLGSADIIAGKADGSENVLRVKAALRDFSRETNLAVITEDGSYYTYNVKYADEPTKLNIEMKDFIHDGEAVNRPNNSMEVYLKELGSESPLLVRLIMQSIYKNNDRLVKHIGCKRFGIQYTLKGIYTHNGLLYFHTELKNVFLEVQNTPYLSHTPKNPIRANRLRSGCCHFLCECRVFFVPALRNCLKSKGTIQRAFASDGYSHRIYKSWYGGR
jgi:conjugative transposon TraN protein